MQKNKIFAQLFMSLLKVNAKQRKQFCDYVCISSKALLVQSDEQSVEIWFPQLN